MEPSEWAQRDARDRQRFSILHAPQCKIAKTLYILLSTAKHSENNQEKSVCTGQGQKSVLYL